MLKMKSILVLSLFLSASYVMSSCGSSISEQTEEAVDEKGKEYTSAYVCPMHCEGSGSDEAGTCPVCGMVYVENKDHEHGHSHDGDGHDHDHDDHEGHNH